MKELYENEKRTKPLRKSLSSYYKIAVCMVWGCAFSTSHALSVVELRERVVQMQLVLNKTLDATSELNSLIKDARGHAAELVPLATGDRNGSVRFWAAYLLAYSGQKNIHHRLIALSGQHDSRLGRAGAMIGLQRFLTNGSPSNSEREVIRLHAVKVIGNKQEDLYIEAIQILSLVPSSNSVPTLARLLRRYGSPTPIGRFTVRALKAINNSSAKGELVKEGARLYEALEFLDK